MTPKLPLLAIFANNALDIITGDYPLDQTNLLGLLKDKSDNALYYDLDGMKWRSVMVSAQYKNSFFNRLLANTVNPKIKVDRTWTPAGSYSLAGLKEEIARCIENDDDILTQFISGEELSSKIAGANDFQSIIKILKRYVFEPEETHSSNSE